MRTVIKKDSLHKFPYEWRLSDGFPAAGIEYHGSKVFSCFAGGGGSSMGYKLAGYDVLGGCEIDEQMAACYERNLKPKIMMRRDIRELVVADNLPDELYNLDVLDGSPPCTSFSMAGLREQTWGKKKIFAEGQNEQTLDDLAFHFLSFAKVINPKVIIIENVTGLMIGNAKKYVIRIIHKLSDMGYSTSLFVINGTYMGLPQSRQRVIITALKNKYSNVVLTGHGFIKKPSLKFTDDELIVTFGEIKDDSLSLPADFKIAPSIAAKLPFCKPGRSINASTNCKGFYSQILVSDNLPVSTIQATRYGGQGCHYVKNVDGRYRSLNKKEIMLASSFPIDYDFLSKDHLFVCGMSVPPVMMAHVATAVWEQWLSKIRVSERNAK